MSLSYPLTPPSAPTFSSMDYIPRTIVGFNPSRFTGQQQTYVWPGQWWEVRASLPPITTSAESDPWIAFLLALNGRQGTFYLGPSTHKTARGSFTGTPLVGAGNTANSTTLTIKGLTGTFAVGDWLQVGSSSSAKLHRIVQVNSATSLDIWPRTRSAYAEDTAITHTNPVGVFRLAADNMSWSVNLAQHTGLELAAVEVL